MQTCHFSTSTVDIRIQNNQFSVLSLTGKESLFSLFCFVITTIINIKDYVASWLSQQLQLHLPRRVIVGVVTEETVSSFDHDCLQLQVTIEPRVALLKHQARANIFLNKNVLDILQQYLIDVGYLASQIHVTCQNCYLPQPYWFQPPQETDLEFIQRIASKAGLFFWSEVDCNHDEIIRIADHNAFEQLPSVIAYTPPSNLPAPLSTQGFYALAVEINSIPDFFNVRDYNEETPDQSVNATVGNASSLYTQQIFGLGCKDSAAASGLCEKYYQSYQVFAEQLEGESSRSDLALGNIFNLDATLWCDSSAYNRAYYVIEVSHNVEQPSGPQGFGKAEIYHNQVTFVDARQQFCWQPIAPPLLPNLLIGHIESDSEYAQLDDAGKYTNRLHLDRSNNGYTQAMPSLRRLTPYGSTPGLDGNSSVHFPLHDRAEILVSHLYGDPDRPMIVGSLYNAEQLSPVTSSNAQQHIFRTAGQNEFLMDDASSVVQLQNPEAVNVLRMDAQSDVQLLSMMTQGQFLCVADNNISYTIGNDCIENIGKDFIQTVAQSYSCCTMQGDLQYLLRETQTLIARCGIFFTAQQDISFQSAGDLVLQSRQIFQINANGEMLQVVASGDCTVQSVSDVQIVSGGKGSITISSGNASIEITDDGVVNFTAPNIVVTGQPVFSVVPG